MLKKSCGRGGVGVLPCLWKSVLRHLRRRRSLTHALELDDRLLQDVGLTRSMLERASRGHRATSESRGERGPNRCIWL